MPLLATQTADPIAPRSPVRNRAIRNVLIVDDSRAQRMIVEAGLRTLDVCAYHAASGEEALAVCAETQIDLVLSDWMMPGMNGIDFCRELRAQNGDRYIYFILLTSKSDKAAVAEGLDVGADDFLTKPLDQGELRARVNAGERVVAMERALRGNNALLTDTLARLRALYDSLDRDLVEARNLQQSLLRERYHDYAEGRISLILRPSGHIGGDMVGFFDISDDVTGIYGFDVSGHGVASALLTARLFGLLSGAAPGHNIAITKGANGPEGRDPAEVAQVMNDLMLSEIQSDRYVTLGYAEIHRRSGRVRLVQAGHPHPLIQHADGRISILGAGGLPVGLLDNAMFESFEAQLQPGERLLLVSDGVTECPNPQGDELGHDGLQRLLLKLDGLRGTRLLDGLMWELSLWHGAEDFPDDVSCALFEYDGPAA